MMKQYLLNLLSLCSDQQFGQDAVEWAIVSGHLKLTYDLEKDLCLIMGQPGQPETGQYSALVEAYQRIAQQNQELLLESYQPLLEELLPTPQPSRQAGNRTLPLAV